ncbi:hypothetical protein [Effusibacillus pohliae]|nr:hypothetical protein [Effusibacillus pohliae]
MRKKSAKRLVLWLFVLGTVLGGGIGWGYYHFVVVPKHHSVTNATEL